MGKVSTNGRKYVWWVVATVTILGFLSTVGWRFAEAYFHSIDKEIHHTFSKLDVVYVRKAEIVSFKEVVNIKFKSIKEDQQEIKIEQKAIRKDIKDLNKAINSMEIRILKELKNQNNK
jgi:uncharacterized membrane protein